MTHLKKLAAGMLLLTGLLLTAGCSQPEAAPPAEPETLKIGVLPIEDIMPLLVAEKNGYFAAENLQVELVKFQSAVEQSSAMQSGSLDGLVTDMIVAAMIKDAGQDLKVTAIALGSEPGEGRFGIAVPPGSAIKTIADLQGKKVGIGSNTIIEYVTDGLLLENGLTPESISKVSVPKLPVRLELLMAKQLDAAVFPEALLKFAEFQGATIIADDTQSNLSQSVVIFDQKTLDGKDAAVQSFFRAYAKAVDDVNSQPADYKQLLIENANIPAPLAESYQLQHYPLPQVPAEDDVTRLLDWMRTKDLLKNPMTYQDLVKNI